MSEEKTEEIKAEEKAEQQSEGKLALQIVRLELRVNYLRGLAEGLMVALMLVSFVAMTRSVD